MEIVALIGVALATGLLTPVQSAANARLAREGTKSTVLASITNNAVGVATLFVFAAALYAAGRLPLPSHEDLASTPWWAFCGGVLGCLFVLSLAYLVPRLGVAQTIGLVVCGQLITSFVIDNFGWLGTQVRPIDWIRVTGVFLLIAGAGLLQWPRS
jgi:bacterial/archaeal transporter family-2 protein